MTKKGGNGFRHEKLFFHTFTQEVDFAQNTHDK